MDPTCWSKYDFSNSLKVINVIGIHNLKKYDCWPTLLFHNQDAISQQLSYSLQHNFFHFFNLAKKMQQIYAYKGCYECFLVAKTYNNTTTNMLGLDKQLPYITKNLVHTNPCVQINHFYNCWCVIILHGIMLKQIEITYATTKWF